jgi:pimeloyl-ACP methyl ester carboxylesterase
MHDADLDRLATSVDGSVLVSWRCPGPGRPVVCLHGAGVSSRELLPLVRALGVWHDTWTVDLPGFGRSDKPPRPLTLAELSDAVVGWLSAVGLSNVCLLGGSFGCQLAVDVAARHPERVGALVLVGPTVDPHARSPLGVLGQWLRNSIRESPRMTPLNLADYRDAGTRRVLATFGEAIRDRIEDKLPHVRVPTLVVRGGKDRMVSQDWAEEVTRRLARGRLTVLPGLPHMVPYKDPAGLARVVADFLATDPS